MHELRITNLQQKNPKHCIAWEDFCKDFLSYPVPNSTDSFYFYRALKLLSKIFYMRIDRAIIEIIFISDDIFHEGVTFDNSFRILEEVFEDRKLCFRKFHFFSAKECDVIFTVNLY